MEVGVDMAHLDSTAGDNHTSLPSASPSLRSRTSTKNRTQDENAASKAWSNVVEMADQDADGVISKPEWDEMLHQLRFALHGPPTTEGGVVMDVTCVLYSGRTPRE